MILRAMQHWGVQSLAEYRDSVIGALQLKRGRRPPRANDIDANDPEVVARINHSRWVASCPLWNYGKGGNCSGVELVDPDAPIFMCFSCGNVQVEGRLLRVRFPGKRTITKIEDLLSARPAKASRNWTHGETVSSIERENREYNVEVP